MREFHSYGPVNAEAHFCLERKELVEQCLQQLVGKPNQFGHYFAIWAARQTGKTWLIEQMQQKIPQRYPKQFEFFRFSLGWLRGMTIRHENDSDRSILPVPFRQLIQADFPGNPEIKEWYDFKKLFYRKEGLWSRPLILMIDEVNTVPPEFLDLLVNQFRELYLARENNWLYGLALVGVRSVLGLDSDRGSPFNIQKSLNPSNLTREEVRELYQQYQEESEQKIESEIVEQVYSVTLGQPGLVSWLGELLTQKHNPRPDQPIGLKQWKKVLLRAKFVEPNNTLVNLIAKARNPKYQDLLFRLFGRDEIVFSFHKEKHNFLYMHGIITPQEVEDETGEDNVICRYSSPFVQESLFHALRDELPENRQVAILDPMDDLEEVLDGPHLDLPALIRRYREYLKRLEKKGINPWKGQPRRTDMEFTESIGHFHLFSWIDQAIGKYCVVSPEFPTGNGQVDLHLRFENKRGIIWIKSFRDLRQVKLAKQQAFHYAEKLGLDRVMVVLFSSHGSNQALQKLSGEEQINGILVRIEVIGMTDDE